MQAIFRELKNMDIDDVIVAGDNIGGFPQPNETIEFLKTLDAKIIRGNKEGYLKNI